MVVWVVLAGGWVSVWQATHATTSLPALVLMIVLAVTAAFFASMTAVRPDVVLVINPALCFSFAILLVWGLVPALVAQVAAVAVVTVRHRLPWVRGVLKAAQFTTAFTAAALALSFHVLRADTIGPSWQDAAGVALVIAAIGAWLVAYVAVGWLLVVVGRRWPRLWVAAESQLGFLLLFKAALLALGPLFAVVAEVNVAFLPLALVPLIAVQRMARLSADRERLTRLDPLTMLANRTMLKERFDHLAARQDQRGGSVAVVLIDLDHFKQVNDSLGHEVGDELLAAVGSRLATMARDEAVLPGRVGGDEFAVIAAVSGVRDLAADIADLLRGPVCVGGFDLELTASIGVAERVAPDDFSATLRQADDAMYRAKRANDTIVHHRPDRPTGRGIRLRLLSELRDALARDDPDELFLVYQPELLLVDHTDAAVEALLRWDHPTEGTIQPRTILDIVEPTALMRTLTQWVIAQAIAQLAVWHQTGRRPRMSVNVSARDLYTDDLVHHLADHISRHRLRPHDLQVEITESALMADPARARATVNAIHALGVDISLDDFGTGFSSLVHLRQLPISEIKIDRSFVNDMTTNPDARAIVASTIDMAHALGLRTVAEGITDATTLQTLVDLGCDLGQGWYLGRPLTAGQIDNERRPPR